MDSRNNHPISKEQFDSWKNNKVTKRLLADLDEVLISLTDNISVSSEPSVQAQKATEFATTRDNIQFINFWYPIETQEEIE